MKNLLIRVKAALVTPVLAVTLPGIIGFWFSWQQLGLRWIDPEDPFSNGWLIGGIALFLIGAAAVKLDYRKSRSSYLILLPLLALGALCQLLYLISIQSGQMALLPLILFCCYWVALGWDQARKLIFPVALLYFAIPVWTPVLLLLQSLTVHVNGFLLGLGGISFSIHGDRITIPVGTFEVAGGCSGLKYFLTSGTLAALYSYWYLPRWRPRLILAGVAISLAMITNWVRVFVIVLIGYHSDMKDPLIKNHNNFGWVLYAVSLVPFFFVANRLAPAPLKDSETGEVARGISWNNFIPVLVTTTLITALFVLTQEVKIVSKARYPTWELTELAPNSTATPGWYPQVFDAATNTNRSFTAPGFKGPLKLTQFLFAEPWYYEIKDYRDDYFPAPWNVLSQSVIDLPGVGRVNSAEVSRAGSSQKWIVLYWYSIAGSTTSSALKAKLLQAYELFSFRYGAALTFLSTDCDKNCTLARQRLIAQSDRLKRVYRD